MTTNNSVQKGEPVWKILYTSESPKKLSMVEIDEILVKARNNNHRDHITGQLIYCYMNFVQVLEGPKEAVEATFAKIQKDSRHTDITLFASYNGFREFPDWDMEFTTVEDPAFFAEFISTMTELVNRLDEASTISADFSLKEFIDKIRLKYG